MSIFLALANLVDSTEGIITNTIHITANTVGIADVGLEKINEGLILLKEGIAELEILEKQNTLEPDEVIKGDDFA